MALKALALISCLLLASCQTNQARMSSAVSVKASTASIAQSLPASLPDSCTSHMGRVRPDGKEPWVVVHSRWIVLADNRDDQADSCREWWDNYRSNLTQKDTK